MQVDVVIPAYNAHRTIDKALASVAMQELDEGDSLQVIIVNDASPDGSYHDCARYWAQMMPVGVVDKKENAGCGQARQTGIDVGTGDAVTFLDADDTLGSPFALRVMLDAMKLEYDIVMGQFVEEHDNKRVITHGENFIWCHAKCYSRKFLEENNLRFNLTRGNEDVGFNSVVRHITEKILYVPQVMYIWHNNLSSTVRAKHNAYCYGYGWRDFIRNMSWAAAELKERNVDEERIAEFLGDVIGRLYWQSMDGHEVFPEDEEENLAELRKFWQETAKPYEDNGILDGLVLRRGYFKVASETPMASIPFQTFNEFLNQIRG